MEAFECKGIIDDELFKSFEFTGGYNSFYNYIKSNVARLVIDLGGELDLQKKTKF